MNTEAQFLRAASDRKGGHLSIYYTERPGKIKKLEPVKEIEKVRRYIHALTETEEYINSDRSRPPSAEVYDAADVNPLIFSGAFPTEETMEVEKQLLELIPKQKDKLDRLIEAFEQLELAFEAGVLSREGTEFHRLLDEFVDELGMY